MDCLASPAVPVSWGELLDKLTILEIKRQRITRPEALANVEMEYQLLLDVAALVIEVEGLPPLIGRLKRINETLWKVEDAIRELEADAQFGDAFIALARCVYKTNDERAAVKKQINLLLGSRLVEEKSYAEGLTPPLIADPAH